MSRNILIVVVVVVIVVLGGLAYAVFRTPEEASAPIQAVPLATNTQQSTVVPTATAAVVDATEKPAPVAQPTAAPEVEATQAPEATGPAEQSEATVEALPTEAPATAAGPIVFEIVQAESEARFIIDEVLRGAPTRVVGVTDQVAGQISVDPADPASAQVGQILVNARTLVTDNEFRNRAIKNRILQTDAFEFVTFQPTQLTGLPDTVAVGEPFTFQITGDLTVRDTTKTVTFDVTLMPVDETRLEGLATLTIPYRDFGLVIPDAPAVDTVADNVTLELEFVAVATQ